MPESIDDIRQQLKKMNEELLELDAELVEPNAAEAGWKQQIRDTYQTRLWEPPHSRPRLAVADFRGDLRTATHWDWRGRNCAGDELVPRWQPKVRTVRLVDADDREIRLEMFRRLAECQDAFKEIRSRRRDVIADIEATRRALQRLFDELEREQQARDKRKQRKAEQIKLPL